MKKLLLVEDEEYAMEDLKDSILGLNPSLEIDTARNGTEALEALASTPYDAMFLDIEMPGMTGIEMLQRLSPPVPPVVLVTAHALHALDAFGLGVVECLLKPVDLERLRRALERITRIENAQEEVASAPPPSTGNPGDVFEADSHVLLREGQRVWFVKVASISRLEANGPTTRVFFPHGSGVVNKPIGDLEGRLEPRLFFRINSTDIINLDAVDHVTASPQGQLFAHFSDGLELPFSPDRSRLFEKQHGI